MADIREMRIGEKETVSFDFQPDLANNEYFTTATAALDTGLSANGTATIGGANNTQISQQFTVANNTADGYYKLTITGTTDGGNIKKRTWLIRVVTYAAPTTANANTALVGLYEAKAYVGKLTDEDDGTIEIVIDSVSNMFDGYTNRNLAYATYTNEVYDGTGKAVFWLRNYPVSGNMTVTENDETLTAGNENDYLCYNSTGKMARMNDTWYYGPKQIQVSYNAGYVVSGNNANLPADIKLAALKQVQYEFSRYMKKDAGETTRSLESGMVTTTQEGLLKDVTLVLDKYKRYEI